jgi:tetratricopeptide (TPR) repeat protein
MPTQRTRRPSFDWSDWSGWFSPVVALSLAVMLPAGCGFYESRQPVHVPSPAARQHLDDARDFRDQGMLDAALAAFGMALEDNPWLIDAHMGIGEIYLQRDQPELAERRYDIAVRIQPGNFDAQYGLALAKQLLGKVHEAIRVYLRALAINPDSVEVNQNLAGAYLQLNRPTDAVPYALRANELDPDSPAGWSNLAAAYALLGDHEQAILAYREAIQLGDGQEPVVVGLADAHIKLGHYDRAVAALESFLRGGPSAAAYERLGYAQFKLRRFEESLASYQAALTIEPEDTAALNGLGATLMTLYIQTHRRDRALHQDAIDAWRRSVRLRPDQPRIIDLISRYQRL